MAKHNPKKILLVDDHPVLRKGMVRLIDANNDFEICGESSNATEAMSLIRERSPDLVIVDIGLPGTSGIELTKTIRGEYPKSPWKIALLVLVIVVAVIVFMSIAGKH